MTKPKRSRREIADAAYLRAQQIDIEGEIEAISTPAVNPAIEAAEVPKTCPGCARAQTLAWGWTIGKDDVLQCGGCACRVVVPAKALAHLREQMAQLLAARTTNLQPAKKKSRGPRTRGAG